MKYLVLFLVSLLLLSCEPEPEASYYRSKFYPINDENSIWNQNAFFINSPAFIRLESRLYTKENSTSEGYFEPIDINNAQLYLDRDIILTNDTISKFTNLLDEKFAEIKMHKVARSGGFIADSYIVIINNNMIDIKTNNGYYTVYIKATTEKKYLINDSTVICVEYK